MMKKLTCLSLITFVGLLSTGCFDVSVETPVVSTKVSVGIQPGKGVQPQKKNAVSTLSDISTRTEKNVMNATWNNIPAVNAKLLTDKAMVWNFNFRPYSAGSANLLWTDPSVQRDVGEGKISGSNRPTALSVVCDETGFAMFVFAAEPEMDAALAAGKDTPNSTLECYIQPGNADNEKIEHYYQFIISQSDNSIRDFPWHVADRNFRPMNGQFKPETRYLSNGYLTKLAFPWHFFWNRLPFLNRDNEMWRFSVMRWCPGGGQSWGGTVHEQTRFGYVVWPEFTPERRTAIMKNILRVAWTRYTAFKRDFNPANFPAEKSPYVQNLPQDNTSHIFLPEYQGFSQEILGKMVAERDALAASIGNFEKLSPAEQEKFYRKNVGKLLNFNYDVQLAFQAWLSDKLIKGETVK